MSDARSLAGPDVAVVGVGARTASGLTALQVTMSARAHKFEPRVSHLIDHAGEEIATARLASIGDDVMGIERFVALGAPALVQAVYPWASFHGGTAPRVPVFVALPSEMRPGLDPRLKPHLLEALSARAGVPLDLSRSALVFGCRGGGVVAFERAVAELRQGNSEVVLVGGIDTYFDPAVLEHLDRERRLHGPETENGFVPGEGAGFVLLALRGRASGLHRYAAILSTATTAEPRPWGAAEPSLGLGVTLAVRRAAKAVAGTRRIRWVLTDVANERHRVDEWAYAAARNHTAFGEDLLHEQPLLKTGDIGAASAAVLVVMAAIRWQSECAAGDPVLVVTHSDGPERGAMLVSREAAS